MYAHRGVYTHESSKYSRGHSVSPPSSTGRENRGDSLGRLFILQYVRVCFAFLTQSSVANKQRERERRGAGHDKFWQRKCIVESSPMYRSTQYGRARARMVLNKCGA
jgi:hypothetical protein